MLSIHSLNVESNTTEIQTPPEKQHTPKKDFAPPPQLKARKEIYYIIYIRAATFISSYKSQQSIGNLNDYRLNATATTANLH